MRGLRCERHNQTRDKGTGIPDKSSNWSFADCLCLRAGIFAVINNYHVFKALTELDCHVLFARACVQVALVQSCV